MSLGGRGVRPVHVEGTHRVANCVHVSAAGGTSKAGCQGRDGTVETARRPEADGLLERQPEVVAEQLVGRDAGLVDCQGWARPDHA